MTILADLFDKYGKEWYKKIVKNPKLFLNIKENF